MWQKEKKHNHIVSLTLLLLLTSPAVIFDPYYAKAQSSNENPSFPLPKTVSSGEMRIDGASSMTGINQNLKESYEKQFPGTKVELAANGTDSALKALEEGKIDLAAIGRGLTPAEKAKGLEQLRVRREKIAIVVSPDNPFKGTLTSKQFAGIFRGEITDWSQVGGRSGKIRFIDRPEISDTRESFRDYPVFKNDKFATGSTATQLADDNTAVVIKQLGKDGISYAIANQISKLEGVRVLRLHNTLPNDARYPFSMPLVYVYKKNPPLPIAGFLGFASAKPGQQAIEAARTAEATAIAASVLQTIPTTPNVTPSPEPIASAAPTTQPYASATPDVTNPAGIGSSASVPTTISNQNAANTANEGISPWWWLLGGLPIFGGLWWLLGRKKQQPAVLETSSQSLEEDRPTAAVGASYQPEVSEVTSDNQLLRAYAQTQSESVDDTTIKTETQPNIIGGGAVLAAGTGAAILSATSPRSIDDGRSISNDIEPITEITPVAQSLEIEPITEITPVAQSDELEPVTEITSLFPATPLQVAEDTFNFSVSPDVETQTRVTEITSIPQADTSNFSEQPPAESNLGVDITPATVPAAVVGAGAVLWSRLSGKKQPEVNVQEDVWDIETPAAETTSPKLGDISIASDDSTSQEDDWDTELTPDETEQSINQSSWLENITSGDTPSSDGGSFWSRLSGTQPEASQDTWDIETPATEISASEEDDWDMQFSEGVTEEQSTNQSNWLENITSVGSAASLGAGAVLWSRLSGKAEPEEEVADTWDIETPPKQPAITEQTNAELPTVQITPAISSLPAITEQTNAELPTVQITPAISELADIPQTSLDVVADAAEPSAQETEEDLSAQSNWDDVVSTPEDATPENTVKSEVDAVSTPDEAIQENAEISQANVTEVNPEALLGGVGMMAAGAGAGSWSRIYGIGENTNSMVMQTTEVPENAHPEVESSITIAGRTAKWAYVSWQIAQSQKLSMRQEGVSQLALRLYDVTDMDSSYHPVLVQQYECEEITHDRYVAIPASDRDYMAEIGYVINSDRWHLLARSAAVRVQNRQQSDFWFQADAELIIHGATQPGATVTIGGHPIKIKPDGTFHLRTPFKDSLIDYPMKAVTNDGKTRIIHQKFFQETQE